MVIRYAGPPYPDDMRRRLRELGMKTPYASILFAARLAAGPEFDERGVLCGADWLLMSTANGGYLLFESAGEESNVSILVLGADDVGLRVSLQGVWIQQASTHTDEYDKPTANAGTIEITLRSEPKHPTMTVPLSPEPDHWEYLLSRALEWSASE